MVKTIKKFGYGLITLLIIASYCYATPWDGSLSSEKIGHPSKNTQILNDQDDFQIELQQIELFIHAFDASDYLFGTRGESILPLGDDDLI